MAKESALIEELLSGPKVGMDIAEKPSAIPAAVDELNSTGNLTLSSDVMQSNNAAGDLNLTICASEENNTGTYNIL